MGLIAGLKAVKEAAAEAFKMFDEIAAHLRKEHPDWSDQQIKDATRTVVTEGFKALLDGQAQHPEWSNDQVITAIAPQLATKLEGMNI